MDKVIDSISRAEKIQDELGVFKVLKEPFKMLDILEVRRANLKEPPNAQSWDNLNNKTNDDSIKLYNESIEQNKYS